MIAIGSKADIIKDSEVVMPSAIPVRNVANFIKNKTYDRTYINGVLFGSESFIPYWQQVHVYNSGYTYTDIKEVELMNFFDFLFPNDIMTTNNALITLQTGQTENTVTDRRLSSGVND